MKQLVTSLINAMNRSRSGLAEVDEQTGAQAQGTPMTELTSLELRCVAGGDGEGDGPHGSWSSEPASK
jgi:hypothetical protein